MLTTSKQGTPPAAAAPTATTTDMSEFDYCLQIYVKRKRRRKSRSWSAPAPDGQIIDCKSKCASDGHAEIPARSSGDFGVGYDLRLARLFCRPNSLLGRDTTETRIGFRRRRRSTEAEEEMPRDGLLERRRPRAMALAGGHLLLSIIVFACLISSSAFAALPQPQPQLLTLRTDANQLFQGTRFVGGPNSGERDVIGFLGEFGRSRLLAWSPLANFLAN